MIAVMPKIFKRQREQKHVCVLVCRGLTCSLEKGQQADVGGAKEQSKRDRATTRVLRSHALQANIVNYG